jgi:hypothetical protein
LADDQNGVVSDFTQPAVILMAHNRNVTYGYTGSMPTKDREYFAFKPGSIIVDPWRCEPEREGFTVIHYGNTRKKPI